MRFSVDPAYQRFLECGSTAPPLMVQRAVISAWFVCRVLDRLTGSSGWSGAVVTLNLRASDTDRQLPAYFVEKLLNGIRVFKVLVSRSGGGSAPA